MAAHVLAMFGNVFGVDGLVVLILTVLIFGRRVAQFFAFNPRETGRSERRDERVRVSDLVFALFLIVFFAYLALSK